MDKLEEFMQGNICLDMRSNPADVVIMSKMLTENYPGMIKPQIHSGIIEEYSRNLYDYFVHCQEHNWNFIIVEKRDKSFNAYRNASMNILGVTMFTAEEIVNNFTDKVKEIQEVEILDLFKE